MSSSGFMPPPPPMTTPAFSKARGRLLPTKNQSWLQVNPSFQAVRSRSRHRPQSVPIVEPGLLELQRFREEVVGLSQKYMNDDCKAQMYKIGISNCRFLHY